MPARRVVELGVAGTVTGLFSGLFGVGGGVVLVPLLVMWLAYGEREATGTSLLAVGFVAIAGTVGQAVYGNVRVEEGLILGAAGVIGVLGGTWLQQRVPVRVITLLLAAVLAAVGVELILP